MNATIVIPVHNQLAYTRACLDSLVAAGCSDDHTIVVDNASTDGTAEYLATRPALRVLTNRENLACAAAWNQGFRASTTRWTVFLNNDTVLTDGWLSQLIQFAETQAADLASPARCDRDLDYDLAAYARDYTARMRAVVRWGQAQGPCFMVDRRVFDAIGEFDENFRRGGNEDSDFFRRAQAAGFRLATTGSSYYHHLGGVTQEAVIAQRGSSRHENITYYRKKWKIGWFERKWTQFQRRRLAARTVRAELAAHGHTLNEVRVGGQLTYQ
jgi:GT2 family glycosyltransferase